MLGEGDVVVLEGGVAVVDDEVGIVLCGVLDGAVVEVVGVVDVVEVSVAGGYSSGRIGRPTGACGTGSKYPSGRRRCSARKV